MTPARTPRLFALLLALFPRAFREVYGDDMRDVFADQLLDSRTRKGVIGATRLWLRMTAAAWAEHRVVRRSSSRDRLPVIESLMADLRLARRSLTRSPLFTLVAVGALSLFWVATAWPNGNEHFASAIFKAAAPTAPPPELNWPLK